MNKTDMIENAFLECEEICRRASSTFYASFSALPYQKRRAVHAVYARYVATSTILPMVIHDQLYKRTKPSTNL